jgi:hypothetical protein
LDSIVVIIGDRKWGKLFAPQNKILEFLTTRVGIYAYWTKNQIVNVGY